MATLPRLLAPLPPRLTPARAAIAAVAAVTALGAPAAVAAIHDLRHVIEPGPTAPAVIALVAAAIAAVIAWRALESRTALAARAVCVMGGAAGGVITVIGSYTSLALLGAAHRIHNPSEIPSLFIGGFAVGAPIGGAFGIAFAPVVVAAAEARLAPTHDGLDRVIAAAGAALMIAGASGVLHPGRFPLAYAGAVAVGALLAAVAVARLLARAGLVAKARSGASRGFFVEPPSGSEEDRALVPFVRSAEEPLGVLVAIGVSAPYRGTRGAVRIARALLPGQPAERPIAALAAGVLDEIGAALLSVPVGLAGIGAVGLAIGMFVFMVSAAAR